MSAGSVQRALRNLGHLPPPAVEGRLSRLVGLSLEARGLRAAVGERCIIRTATDVRHEAEVVGFNEERVLLMPLGHPAGLGPDARVSIAGRAGRMPVGAALLGRVVDARGAPLDAAGAIHCDAQQPLIAPPLNPLERRPVADALDVGVRAINALLTVARGQRIGLFAGSGVGKSVLLGMMARHTAADVIVVGLIGERGREVQEFTSQILSAEERTRSVVVAAPADAPPLLRLQGAWYATAIAEHFRDQGKDVLLLMDSLTRFAQAQREIGLAIGESPASRGYPPSVFARLPQLVERSGMGTGERGSITAFYTVLTEGDDLQDPVADAARAILDGHVVLARRLADSGHFPAIDVEASVSRVMQAVASSAHLEAARRMREAIGTHERARDLISLGAVKPGADPALDRILALWPQTLEFLRQRPEERAGLASSIERLATLAGDL